MHLHPGYLRVSSANNYIHHEFKSNIIQLQNKVENFNIHYNYTILT